MAKAIAGLIFSVDLGQRSYRPGVDLPSFPPCRPGITALLSSSLPRAQPGVTNGLFRPRLREVPGVQLAKVAVVEVAMVVVEADGDEALDLYEVRLPNLLCSMAECEDDEEKTSIIMVDDRDDRIVSPFQAWLVREIITKSANSVNVLTDRDQVTPPSSGFHLSLFTNYTLDGVKASFVVSVDSVNGGPCGGLDGPTTRALSQHSCHFHGQC